MLTELQRYNPKEKVWDTLTEGSRSEMGKLLSKFRNLFKFIQYRTRVKPLQ